MGVWVTRIAGVTGLVASALPWARVGDYADPAVYRTALIIASLMVVVASLVRAPAAVALWFAYLLFWVAALSAWAERGAPIANEGSMGPGAWIGLAAALVAIGGAAWGGGWASTERGDAE